MFFKKAKIYIVNDTSKGHAGSRAVMQSLNRIVEKIGTIEQRHYVGDLNVNKEIIEKSDIIFINGEGTFHHNSPGAVFIDKTIKLAVELNKKVFLVNTSFFQNIEPEIYKNIYIACRELFSYNIAKSYGLNPFLFLDSAADKRFLNLKGKNCDKTKIAKGITHPHSPFYKLEEQIEGETIFLKFPFNGVNFKDFIINLKNISLYITGQYHGIYAAGLAGIPFIAIPSNTHKIESLISWSGCNIPIYNGKDSIEILVEKANNKEEYAKFHNFLLENNPIMFSNLKEMLK
jgi:hypothetical protein